VFVASQDKLCVSFFFFFFFFFFRYSWNHEHLSQISRLEFMHSRGVLHRDIQLGNCVLGQPGTVYVLRLMYNMELMDEGSSENTIYMIDFGFAKQYIDPKTKRHIPDSRIKRQFVGNYWFSSVGVHCRGKGRVFWSLCDRSKIYAVFYHSALTS
jgi:serine/threonine protein kinase